MKHKEAPRAIMKGKAWKYAPVTGASQSRKRGEGWKKHGAFHRITAASG